MFRGRRQDWLRTRVVRASRTGLLATGVVLAVLLGVAALVVAIVTATRGHEPSPPPQIPHAEAQQLFVDDADREPLCDADGPLMKESTD